MVIDAINDAFGLPTATTVYVNGDSGSDAASGRTAAEAVKTFTRARALCSKTQTATILPAPSVTPYDISALGDLWDRTAPLVVRGDTYVEEVLPATAVTGTVVALDVAGAAWTVDQYVDTYIEVVTPANPADTWLVGERKLCYRNTANQLQPVLGFTTMPATVRLVRPRVTLSLPAGKSLQGPQASLKQGLVMRCLNIIAPGTSFGAPGQDGGVYMYECNITATEWSFRSCGCFGAPAIAGFISQAGYGYAQAAYSGCSLLPNPTTRALLIIDDCERGQLAGNFGAVTVRGGSRNAFISARFFGTVQAFMTHELFVGAAGPVATRQNVLYSVASGDALVVTGCVFTCDAPVEVTGGARPMRFAHGAQARFLNSTLTSTGGMVATGNSCVRIQGAWASTVVANQFSVGEVTPTVVTSLAANTPVGPHTIDGSRIYRTT
jgi:hypothetical protein